MVGIFFSPLAPGAEHLPLANYKTTNFTNYKKVLTSNGGHLFFATRSWG